ncbi:cytochrome b [Roseomonas fluvialis]|uniref:Cytochrome b n=1 Tax=Roseomonas fluvialis TaxID=1750527 RepID=A0ABM7Y0W5_9PROT|nr:cytochrome b/b6 domain-containing protein [Roseomonas fluvialis]BDG71443.1 cytochrome b [Roseomonas fluvialis]
MDASTAGPLPGQDAAHPHGQYGRAAKWFHWITLGLMLVALPTGFVIKFITGEADGAYKMGFYAIHESAGLTILFAAIARIAWKVRHPPPPHPADLPPMMRKAAAATHHGLYALLILQPLMGFFMTNAFGFPMQGRTAYLGFIDLPKFMEPSEGLANALSWGHTIGGYLFVVLLVAHIGGAVFHHAIRRDGTLMRML